MSATLEKPMARAPSNAARQRKIHRPTRVEEPMLPCRVRLADGRVYSGTLPAARHRALQLGMLHCETDGLVELTPGTRRPGAKVDIDRRKQTEHYLLGGGRGSEDEQEQPSGSWLAGLLAHAQAIVDGRYALRHFPQGPREEAFVGVTPRSAACGEKQAVSHTRYLWVDVDKPGELPALWALLAERPCHLLIESAGSGGVHAYWRMEQPLQATTVNRETGELHEWIERANRRLIHALGCDPEGKASVGDPQCANRSRVMRLAGTINWKTGRYARIIQADLALDPYPVMDLVGDLPDPKAPVAPRRARPAARGHHDDPFKRIAPVDYFQALTGVAVPRIGLVRCPSRAHQDEDPSCSVGGDASGGWMCHGCGAAGAIYDLASVLLDGPTGQELRGDAFKAARELVVAKLGTP